MNKEYKDLILKDLCARLPYKPWCEMVLIRQNGTFRMKPAKASVNYSTIREIECGTVEVKPYLFPLSSMTEEQKIQCFKGKPIEIDKYGDISAKEDFCGNSQYTDLEIYLEIIDWLNKNHFDYRGLIEKGLAIDATGLNIY